MSADAPSELIVLSEAPVRRRLLANRRHVIEQVADGYRTFWAGKANVPHSLFLRFDDPRNRIIALPAFRGGDTPVAGIKWVASFPPNHERGLRRATATMVLNSATTGFPEAFVEATHISAHRTAASAALAAKLAKANVRRVAVIGCGPIAQECLAYLHEVLPLSQSHIATFDLVAERAEAFAAGVRDAHPEASVEVGTSAKAVIEAADTVLLCTTAAAPHLDDITFAPGATVLHVSLRDLSPALIGAHRNFVDDLDHVNRAATSIDLTAQALGHTNFVVGSIGDLLAGAVQAREQAEDVVIVSPFGLGILDLVVATWVVEQARAEGEGVTVPGFVEPT
ncbi:MAG: 2,3-diaminopropionate biosynthesis protein SbnB [Myxococcota bacterium]